MSARILYHSWRRFVHSGSRLQNQIQWTEPSGSKTDIVVYNPLTKTKTPLILKNSNVAMWYMCGPTIYDSAHIGHARYLKNFNINLKSFVAMSVVFQYIC